MNESSPGNAEALRLLQASSCFRGEVCHSLPCACAETLAARLALPAQGAVTDIICKAAINADREDRIQGCSYKERYVIYDTWLPQASQEIWSAPVGSPADYQAFQSQCKIERMRKVLEAAYSLSSTESK